MEADDLLNELLDRVRHILRCDTAVILLLDQHARQLVAIAAKGLEREVQEGVRVSVGRGFAGRIAAQAQPMALSDL